MRIEEKYMLGTVREIATSLAGNILDKGRVTHSSQDNFKDCDFSVLTGTEDLSQNLECIMSGVEGIYGIKKLHTGFDNYDLDLFADYYGGGSGHYVCIFPDMYEAEVVDIIKDVMLKTLSEEWKINEDSVIIAEWLLGGNKND